MSPARLAPTVPSRPLPPHRTQRHRILIALNLLIWSAAIVTSLGRFKLAAKPTASVILTTTPKAVQIAVDQQPLFGGDYASTPLKVPLAPGTREVAITRDGYTTHSLTFSTAPGETLRLDPITLEPDPEAHFGKVEVHWVNAASPTDPVIIDINAGLVRGAAPLQTNALIVGKEYTLMAYATVNSKQPLFACRFTLKQANGDSPYRIKLKTHHLRRIQAIGCSNIASHKTPNHGLVRP